MLLLHVIEGDPVRRYVVRGSSEPPMVSMDWTGNIFRLQLPQWIVRHDLYEEARWKLSALLPPGLRGRFRSMVTVGKAADEIVRIAREQKADLIMMATQVRRGLWRLLRRSVADKVLRKAPTPVMTLWGSNGVLPQQRWASELALGEASGEHMTERRESGELCKSRWRPLPGRGRKDQIRVQDIMTHAPIAVTQTTAVDEARNLMEQRRIRHLPVLDNERLVGIVTDRDIRLVLPSPATSLSIWEINHLLAQLTVGEVMTPHVITVDPDRNVTEALGLMLTHNIGALPVVENRGLVGILTRTDLLRAFLTSQTERAGAAKGSRRPQPSLASTNA